MNKKALYESIMRQVSKEVKKALNESMDDNFIQLDKQQTDELEYDFCEYATELACEDESCYESRRGCVTETVHVDNDYTINGMDGKLVGTLTYAVDYYTTADYEVMCEDDCFIEEYDLKFIYDGDEYTVDLTLE